MAPKIDEKAAPIFNNPQQGLVQLGFAVASLGIEDMGEGAGRVDPQQRRIPYFSVLSTEIGLPVSEVYV